MKNPDIDQIAACAGNINEASLFIEMLADIRLTAFFQRSHNREDENAHFHLDDRLELAARRYHC